MRISFSATRVSVYPPAYNSFPDSLKLSYPLLSDYPDMKVIRKYGALIRIGEEKRPMAQPSYFLVDKQGIVGG